MFIHFLYVYLSLQFWNKLHLIMVYYLSSVLLDLVSSYFVVIFWQCVYLIRAIGLKFSFFTVSLSSFSIRVILA